MIQVKIDKKGYDYKKTLNKILKSAAVVLLTGILAVYSEEPLVLVLIPLIEGALNYLKHKDK